MNLFKYEQVQKKAPSQINRRHVRDETQSCCAKTVASSMGAPMTNPQPTKTESVLVDGKLNPAWLTVFAGTIGLVFGPSTMTILSFGVFVRPLQQEFGWTLGQTVFAATIISYMIMLVAPIQGILTDRYGGRAVVVASIPLFAAAYSLLYFLPNNLYLYYGLWILIPVCAVGVWPLSYLRSTATWFDRHLGLSLGITNSGIGSIIVPALAGFMVAHYGWRAAYLVLAGLALIVTWPLTLAYLKDNPAVDKLRQVRQAQTGSSFSEAARTSTFIITAIAFFVLGSLSSGLVVLQVPMFIEAGISPQIAAGLASVVGVSMIIGRIGTGYLLDVFHASKVLMWFILASSLAALVFALGVTLTTAPFAAALVGLIIGAEFDALSYIIPRYYGHRSFGRIYGAIYAIFQLGAGLGIASIGFSRDLLGSFRPSMWILCVLTVAAGLLFSRLGEYKYAPGHIEK
jgi:MFS family permease